MYKRGLQFFNYFEDSKCTGVCSSGFSNIKTKSVWLELFSLELEIVIFLMLPFIIL